MILFTEISKFLMDSVSLDCHIIYGKSKAVAQPPMEAQEGEEV
jgi:hypothetical protein